MLVHKFCHPTSHFLADVSNHCLVFLCQISKLQGDLKWGANKTKHKITHTLDGTSRSTQPRRAHKKDQTSHFPSSVRVPKNFLLEASVFNSSK